MADYLGLKPEDIAKASSGFRNNMPVPIGGAPAEKPKIPTNRMPIGITGLPPLGGSGPTAPTETPPPAPGIPPIPGLPPSGFRIFGKGLGGPTQPVSPLPTPGPVGLAAPLPVPTAPAPKTQAAPTLTRAPGPVAVQGPLEPIKPSAAPTPVKVPMPLQGTSTDVATPTPGGKKTIDTVTGQAAIDGKPVGPAPVPLPNTNVATPTPTVGKGDINATTGEPIAPVDPAKTPIEDSLTEFETIARGWMEGTNDEVFRVAANRVMERIGLMNAAERDAMQMRINQDPELRGQGAGRAMLQIMSRNQNFTEGQIFGQLAEDSRQRILDLQKYGFEAGMKINEVRRNRATDNFNALYETGQFEAATTALQDIIDRDMPGSGIKVNADTFASRDSLNRSDFDQNMDTIRTLALTDKAGATSQIAALMAENPSRFPPGMTADQFVATLEEEAKRDQWSQAQFASQMELIKNIATTNPAAATGMLATIMNNPAYKGWFPEGATADQLIKSFTEGSTGANLTEGNLIEREINTVAGAGQSFDEVSGSYDDLFRLKGRDAIAEGRRLSIDQINTLREADGLAGFSKDAEGNLVDENGIPLTEEDYAELAYRKDYQDKVAKFEEAPWERAKDLIMKSPSAEKFLDESLFPGSKDALDSYLESYYLNPGNFIKDPETGLLTPDTSNLQLPWKSPEYYHVYFTWPQAVFDENGQVKKDSSGKLVMDMGGDVYGEELNGEKVVATPADAEMDKLWVKYQRSGGKLTAPQWYFATAGGTRPPNEANLPAELKTGEDFQNVGNPGASEPGTVGGLEAAKAKVDELASSLPAGTNIEALKSWLDKAVNEKFNANDMNDLKHLPGYVKFASSVKDKSQMQPGWDYLAFTKMVQGGLTEKQASELVIGSIGEARFKTGYKAMTGKDWA